MPDIEKIQLRDIPLELEELDGTELLFGQKPAGGVGSSFKLRYDTLEGAVTDTVVPLAEAAGTAAGTAAVDAQFVTPSAAEAADVLPARRGGNAASLTGAGLSDLANTRLYTEAAERTPAPGDEALFWRDGVVGRGEFILGATFSGAVYLSQYVSATQATEDNAARIAAAIAATPVGGWLFGPEYDIYTGPIDINKRINVMLPGKLIRHSGQIDTLVTVSAADAYFQCREVDYDAEGETSWTGRGEAVRLSGARVKCVKTIASNTPAIGTGNTFEIRGADSVLEDCESINAGYAGFRTFDIATLDANDHPIGDCWLTRCKATNYRVKGWVNNRHAGTVYISGWDSSFNSSVAAATGESLLCETGEDYRFWRLVLSDTTLQDGPTSNLLKSDGCRHIVVLRSFLEPTSNIRPIRIVASDPNGPENYEKSSLLLVDSDIGHGSLTSALVSNNYGDIRAYRTAFRRGAGGTTTEYVECTHGHNYFEDCRVAGAVAQHPFVALRNDSDGKLTAKVEIVGLRNDSEQLLTAFRFPDGTPDAAQAAFVGAVGEFDISTSNSLRMAVRSSRGLPGIRFRPSSQSPAGTGGTWERGEQIIHSDSAAAGNIGRVCTTAGTTGTLSGVTGSITSATTALTVSSGTNLRVGQYITIVGVTGTKRITAIDGTDVTIDVAADATVSGADVAFSAPVFKTFGAIEA